MAQQMVIEEYELMDENDSPPSEKKRRLADDNQGLSLSANSSTLWSLIDKMVDESNTDQEESESQSSAENTVDSYLREPVTSRKRDPLKFWKEKQSVRPVLSIMARKYLSIQTTSVPSERLFSTSGLISTDLRNRLQSEKIEMLLFLNKNLRLFDFKI